MTFREVFFTLEIEKKSKNKSAISDLSELKQLLHKHKKGKGMLGADKYKIRENSEEYSEVVKIAKKYPKDVEFLIYDRKFIMDEQDVEEAVGFIPLATKNDLEEYDDGGFEYLQCEKCLCNRLSDNDIHVRPSAFTKKHDGEPFVAFIVGINEILLSWKLVDILVEHGVGIENFKSVTTIRKKLIGYIFAPQNILPENGVVDGSAIYSYKICKKCGAVIKSFKKDIYYNKWIYMNNETIDKMRDINYTYEFHGTNRDVIVNRKIMKLINENVKDVTFIPIFEKV